MRIKFRRSIAVWLQLLIAMTVGLGLMCQAAAQTAYPSKPVRIVVPFAPGGATDASARLMSKLLSQKLGQPFVIENKPGGDTAIGAQFVAKSPADGYTLLFTNDATFVLNPILFASLPYKPSRDFAPVAMVAYLNLGLAVSGDLPVATMKELVEYIKTRPGSLAYGSSGTAGQAHLMGEMFKKISGADVVHVPYKGLGPALTDVLGGHAIFTFPSISTVQGFVKGGKAKVLAISGEARSPLLPDVPTFTEVGFKDMDMGAWYAFLAPAGTPREAIDRINKAVAEILADPEVLKEFNSKGMQAAAQTTEQFSNFIRTETERMTRMVKSSGIKVE